MRVYIFYLCLILPIWGSGQEHPGENTDAVLKVMSYNIRIASPPSKGWGHTDLQAIADVINREQPDLVALQEVDVYTERSGKTSHQAKELAGLTGMYWHFAKAVDRSGGDYGVAVLSKYPVIKASSYQLPVTEGSEGEVRGAALIFVRAGRRKVGFMSAHLDHLSDEDRLFQVKKLNRILHRYADHPIIFGADLNMERNNPVIREMEKKVVLHCLDCQPTFPAHDPEVTLDYVMLNPAASRIFRVKDYRLVHETYASDHLPLVMELVEKRD